MDWIYQAAQLILSLSILIVLHEMGHFIPAKLFKTRVEKFYLFFDPWFSLFKVKKGETEYGIGWLPLGGYVKISGMIDESMDKEQMKLPPEDWEFRAKPAWQRLIIMLGGVTVNAILGIAIYIMISFVWGSMYLPTENLTYGIYCDSTALAMGLENGDKIISIDGKEVKKFNDARKQIVLNRPSTIEVQRNGREEVVDVPSWFTATVIKNEKAAFIQPAYIAKVDEVAEGSNAEKAGLMHDDQIVKIDNDSTPFFYDVVKYLRAHKEKEVQLGIVRNGEFQTLNASVSDKGTLGFQVYKPSDQLTFETQHYTALTAIPAGFNRGYEKFSEYLQSMKLIFDPEVKGYESLGGFIMIGKAYDPEWIWQQFWDFTAFLSIILAIMNLLPIPALDGGHVMFLLYEMITRRKPHEKVLEYAQIAGMIFLFALLIYANGNDIIRLFK